MSVRVTIFGAARTVTGSRYLIEHEDQRILVDCGLFQGRKELRLRNWGKSGFDPSSLTAVVLTHAHIDHTGYLPLVVKQGFRGNIWGTRPTVKLTEILLKDSAHLQVEEAGFATRHGTSKHVPALPLYDEDDVRKTVPLLRLMEKHTWNEVLPGVRVYPSLSGHILGACSLTVEVGGKRIVFSGDVGRYDVPILPDPEPLEFGDLLFVESTYGDRLHDRAHQESELIEVIHNIVRKGGPLLIPAFAVGRTQHLLYVIADLERRKKIPVMPVYVDTPMGVEVTELYREYGAGYTDFVDAAEGPRRSRLLTEKTVFCRTVDESKHLNQLQGPRIIIAGSGMVNGGRILHHMKRWLPNPGASVLFVGYQAEETRGRRIQDGEDWVKIFGDRTEVRATVKTVSGLSAHGDRDELLRWLSSCKGTPGNVRVTHGESAVADAFSQTLHERYSWSARPGEQDEQIELA